MHPNELSREEKKESIIYGVIVGLLTVAFSIVSIYYTSTAASYSNLFVVSTIIKIVSAILIPVGFVYLLKVRNGSKWTFSRALKSIYILIAASIIVTTVGVNISNKLIISREVIEEGYQNLMNLKIEDMELSGASDEEIDQQLEIIEQDRDFALTPLSFQSVVPPMFISLLINFLFALVLAFLFRSHVQKKS